MPQTKEVPANIRQCVEGLEQLIYNQLSFLGKAWRTTYETNLPWCLAVTQKVPPDYQRDFVTSYSILNKKRLQRVVVVNGGIHRNSRQCYFRLPFHQVPNLQFDFIG